MILMILIILPRAVSLNFLIGKVQKLWAATTVLSIIISVLGAYTQTPP
jgi:hypothetical protein